MLLLEPHRYQLRGWSVARNYFEARRSGRNAKGTDKGGREDER